MSFELFIAALMITAAAVAAIVVAVRFIFWLGDRAHRFPAMQADQDRSGLGPFFKLLLSLPLVVLLLLGLLNISFQDWSSLGLSLGAIVLVLGLLVTLWLNWESLRDRINTSPRLQLFFCVVGTLVAARLTVTIATGDYVLPRPCTHKSALICGPLNFLFDLGGRYAAAALPGSLTLLCLWASAKAARRTRHRRH